MPGPSGLTIVVLRPTHRIYAAALLATSVACAGGQFHLDPRLERTPMLQVYGDLGMGARSCEASGFPLRGFMAGKGASITVGSLSGAAAPPHRDLTTERLFTEALLRDYQQLLERYADAKETPLLKEALPVFDGQGRVPAVLGQVDDVLRAIRAVLSVPRSATETMTFGFAGKREGRIIVAACTSANTTRTLGAFDGPRFSLACRIASSGDAIPRDLHVTGQGTWANFAFAGELYGKDGEREQFASQNISILGAGGIRGFHLRALSGDQTAAISFWHVDHGNGYTSPGAWEIASPTSPSWSDARIATLALAYVFPWPSGCDDQRIRSEGLRQ
jgi:hypothetical protein